MKEKPAKKKAGKKRHSKRSRRPGHWEKVTRKHPNYNSDDEKNKKSLLNLMSYIY